MCDIGVFFESLASYICDTAVHFESSASYMCDVLMIYTHIYVQVNYQLIINCVDYPYYVIIN